MSDLDTLQAQRDQAAADALAAEQAVAEAAAVLAAAQRDHAEAHAAFRAAQDVAATADLEYGNAVNAAARAAETQRLNDELAARNPRKRLEMQAAGILTEPLTEQADG